MEQFPPLEVKKRLDVALLSRGLVRSRSAASDLVKRGKVSVNGKVATKPNTEVSAKDEITLESGHSYVSRAGEKLSHALDTWKLDVAGLTALDIGASTGGFTDCLLQRGAAKVITVDVGTDQLATTLRNDSRVEVHENTDIRKFELESPVDLVVIDVSFISLETILPKAYDFVKKGGNVIALVKPQFEVGKEIADRFKGVIADEAIQNEALAKVKGYAKKAKLKVTDETLSPIEGEKGNREFLLLMKKV